MSAQADLLGLETDQQTTNTRSNGLTLNLSSNNPFRNRAASPNSFSPPPHSPFDDPPPRPTSTNPFLDPSTQLASQRVASPDKMASPKKPGSPTAEELFDNLIIDDGSGKKPVSRPTGARPPGNRPPGGPPRGENAPPRGRGPSHRPTRSQEEALKARRLQGGPSGSANVADSPQKRLDRRPRRNSESSIMDKDKPMTEEEKKARELRRKERERRHRDGKERPRTNRKIDLIDQLDATGIYGSGLFHHDGPFDACNPHRNRKGSKRAPMHAFAEDSLNNSIGGSGPLNKRPDHAAIMGHHDEEAFKDYSTGVKDNFPRTRPGKPDAPVFDPKSRGSVLHGDESMGLGTSTFLEGTPAARAAIERRQAETAEEVMAQGLQRKKSLAQRFKSINRGPGGGRGGRGPNTERIRSPRTGDLPTSSSTGERNPFFNEFDKGEEQISIRRTDTNPMSPTSPDLIPSLERRATTDATNPAVSPDGQRPQGGGAGGFITRIKSLKGGRRQRPEKPDQGPPPYSPGATTPGTAV